MGSSFWEQTYLCHVNILPLLLFLPGSIVPSKGSVSYGQAAKTHHWPAAVSMETTVSVPSWEGAVNEHETIHINCSLILLFFISMPLWILDYKYAGSWGRRFSWFDISLECRCAVKWDIVYSLYEAYKENTLRLLGLLLLCVSYIGYIFIQFQKRFLRTTLKILFDYI